ncbi:MAG: hypothetical protein U0271_13910 [Polyangiaceae bacterium]
MVELPSLDILDRESFQHVSLMGDLEHVVEKAKLRFYVPAQGRSVSWDRALLYNQLYWEEGTADVLAAREIPADVVAHVAWHHLTSRHLQASAAAHLLGEAIASAFDVYLVGRLLGHQPDSEFLGTQVPRMAERAEDAGVGPSEFESLLEGIASEPERAFEDLRSLLFDAACTLADTRSIADAEVALQALEKRRFGCLLHHFDLAIWVLRTRAELGEDATTRGEDSKPAHALDASLRASSDSLAELERRWLEPLRREW